MKPKNVIQVSKRIRDPVEDEDLSKSWRQVLGNPPKKENIKDWIVFQKKKWAWQRKQKQGHQRNNKRQRMDDEDQGCGVVVRTGVNRGTGTIGKNIIHLQYHSEPENLKKSRQKTSRNQINQNFFS